MKIFTFFVNRIITVGSLGVALVAPGGPLAPLERSVASGYHMYSRSEAAFFATSKTRSFGTPPIRPPQGRCNVGTERRDTANSAPSIEKIHFFNKARSVGASWAPVSQGRSLAATLYARCLGVLLLLQVTHIPGGTGSWILCKLQHFLRCLLLTLCK